MTCSDLHARTVDALRHMRVCAICAEDWNDCEAGREALDILAEHDAAAQEATITVQYDLSPAQIEGAIRDKLITLGWTPPGTDPMPVSQPILGRNLARVVMQSDLYNKLDDAERAECDRLALLDDDMCPNCISPWKCNGPHIGARPAHGYEEASQLPGGDDARDAARWRFVETRISHDEIDAIVTGRADIGYRPGPRIDAAIAAAAKSDTAVMHVQV